MGKKRVWLSWSSGKDSAHALHILRQDPGLEVVGLLTSVTEAFDRVAMHAVRTELLAAQARELGLPLRKVTLPYPCSNEIYEAKMKAAIAEARAEGISYIAFGDLFLADIRAYRERLLAGTGVEPIFPLWDKPTAALAREMVASGIKAVLTCVDPRKLAPELAGREFDENFLAELPEGVDPCGENGEFHTFVYAAPGFRSSISIRKGETVERDGFFFADVFSAKNPVPL